MSQLQQQSNLCSKPHHKSTHCHTHEAWYIYIYPMDPTVQRWLHCFCNDLYISHTPIRTHGVVHYACRIRRPIKTDVKPAPSKFHRDQISSTGMRCWLGSRVNGFANRLSGKFSPKKESIQEFIHIQIHNKNKATLRFFWLILWNHHFWGCEINCSQMMGDW